MVLAIIGAFIAAAATAAALWQGLILRHQLADDIAIRRASFHQGVANLLRELDFIFFSNPGLRPYFYLDKIPKDPLTEQQTLALAEYIMDLIECYTAAEKVYPALVGDWDDYFHFLYTHSHAIRKYWQDFGHLYPPDVRRALLGPSARPKQWPDHMKYDMINDEPQETGIGPTAGTKQD